MIYLYLVLFTLFSFSPLHAVEDTIELISNHPINAENLNNALSRNNIPLKVFIGDLNKHGNALKKNRTQLGHYLRKFSLDLPLKAPVDKSISKIIFYNVDRDYKRFTIHKFPKDKMILFMWEPPCVLRQMYSTKTASWFSKVYTWDDDLVDNTTHFKFYYPVMQPMIETLPSFEEKKLCTLVSSDLASKHPNELYSERRRVIAFFEKESNADFEFYGRYWNPAEHPSYRGTIEDKINTIKNYRFSICYENSTHIKGYITEKIFDCFAAGNVPIYWGAINIEDYIPKNCYIDRRDFQSTEEVYAFIKGIDKEQYEQYLFHIRNFLKSAEAQLFSGAQFEKIFCDAVKGL